MQAADKQEIALRSFSSSGALAAVVRRIVKKGHLRVIDAEGRAQDFGNGEGPLVTIRFEDAKIQRAVLFDPGLALPEGYMQGRIKVSTGSIYDLLALFAQNTYWRRFPSFLTLVPDGFRWFSRTFRQLNLIGRARRNAAAHYDLPDWLYNLFLDPNRQYSCGYFPTPDVSLEEAQLQKMELIAKKLCLRDGDSVLDIGSGWGGLARYLARRQRVEVTGITLSSEQLHYARAQKTHDLKGCVGFELKDYRQVSQKFDRIVSVGMLEHVGVPNYRSFFKKVSACLRDDGVALIHTIGRLSGPGFTNPFIEKYIFPGGYCPALSELVPHIETSGLIMTDIEVLRLHYARTLAAWRRNFEQVWDSVADRLSEEFCRMWQFYLAGSEVAFRYHDLAVFQIQLAKKVDVVPVTRQYLFSPAAEERAPVAQEADCAH